MKVYLYMAVKKVICAICNQEISVSNYSKHQRRHELHPETFNKSSYRITHDGLWCQFCEKICKNRNSLCNHERLCKLNPNRQESGFVYYNASGRTAWNKGLNKLVDERVEKNGESIREHYKNFPNKQTGRKLSEEHKKKISATILEKSRRGEWHTSLAHKMHYKYNGEDLHGTWELEYAKYLDKNNIKWNRNKKRFSYYLQDKIHYYTPDFYLIDENTFIEIKGFKTDKDEAKWSQFPKSENLKILFYEDLRNLGLHIHR